MAARDVIGGLGSVLLLVAQILFCLLFTVYDRLIAARAPEPQGGERVLLGRG